MAISYQFTYLRLSNLTRLGLSVIQGLEHSFICSIKYCGDTLYVLETSQIKNR